MSRFATARDSISSATEAVNGNLEMVVADVRFKKPRSATANCETVPSDESMIKTPRTNRKHKTRYALIVCHDCVFLRLII